MKIKYDMFSQARISLESRAKINPVTMVPVVDGKGKPVYEDVEMEVPVAVAKALEELQNRIDILENAEKAAIIRPTRRASKYNTKKRKAEDEEDLGSLDDESKEEEAQNENVGEDIP